jgi:hypothetical protein
MAFTRAISNGSQRKRLGGERHKSQLDFDVDENGGRKKTKSATNYVAHAVANTPPVLKARPVAKRVVTNKKKLVKRASVKKQMKKPVKKASEKKASEKKASVNKFFDFTFVVVLAKQSASASIKLYSSTLCYAIMSGAKGRRQKTTHRQLHTGVAIIIETFFGAIYLKYRLDYYLFVIESPISDLLRKRSK